MKFLDALLAAQNDKKNIVIPDIKCFSPKEGDLMRGRNPVEYALQLEAAGAPVLSVVTEEKEFHGSLTMLRDIAAAVKVPILRKDFIHTREDLLETMEAGASAILLMCSCLEREELIYLYEQALEIGLDPFVETHVKEDFELVNQLAAKLVGINNRDILVLERDNGNVNNTISLASYAPKDAFLITESSIQNPAQVRAAIKAGADAALVGTAILQAEYTEAFYRMMCRKVSLKVCGLTNEEDIKICVRLGVERIGLIVEYFLDVPWNLTRDRASKLRAHIPNGYQACMVTGGSQETILTLCDIVKPDLIQLHYNKETIEQTKLMMQLCAPKGIGIIKTIPLSETDCLEQFGSSDIEEVISLFNSLSDLELLIDPRHGKDIASNKLQLDVDLAKKVVSASQNTVILAGGLKADNLGNVMQETSCVAIDVLTASEDEPGKKNEEKIKELLSILDA